MIINIPIPISIITIRTKQTTKKILIINKKPFPLLNIPLYLIITIPPKATVEEKNTAFEELKRVNGKQAKEEMIEEKLKTELKLDTFVKVEGDQIRVVVGSKEHSASLANEVMRLIQELFDSKMYISVQFQN